MRLFRVLLTLSVFFAGIAANAQNFRVKGTAVDSTGMGEAFATIRIYALPDTVKPISTAVTKEDGTFDKTLTRAGKYRFLLTSVGRAPLIRTFELTTKAPVADLGTLTVTTGAELGEVVVTAQKPLISREIDRIGYDVQNDPEAKTSQLDEMLKKVPLVSVDPDGTIKVKGSSSFVIYKNGRKNNSFSNNAKDIFKAIPASMIKRIEVITDPGAREDAEGVGTILNIVTEENLTIKGVMGNVGLTMSNTRNIPSPNVWIMSQIDKVTFNVYANYGVHPSRSGREHHETQRTFDDSENTSRESTDQSVRTSFGNIGLELSYEMDSLNLFTAEFDAYLNSMKTNADFSYGMFNPADELIYSYRSHRLTDPSRFHWLDGTFNYQHLTHRKGEKIIATYMISGNGRKSKETNRYYDQINMPVAYTGIDYDNSSTFLEHTFQADWTRPLWTGHTLDLGVKYIYRDNHSRSDQQYIDQGNYKTDFSHITQVAAAFADYRVNIGRWGLRAGVRYEFSRLEAKYKLGDNDNFHSNLSDLVPNGAVSFNINDRNSLRLSYSSSIQRPGINYLNPTIISNPQSQSQGNPDLSSTRNHSLNFNYSLFTRKFSMDFNAGYYFTDNAIIQIQQLLPDDRIGSTYANAGKDAAFNANIWMQLQAGAKTRIMFNGGIRHSRSENPSLGIKVQSWNPSLYARLTQTLPWKMSLGAYVNYWGRSKTLYSVFTPIGMAGVYHGLDLQRSFLKENRLNVRLSVSNPFGKNESRYKSYMINVPYTSNSYSTTSDNRSVSISLSYRFGNLNAQVKKVRSVRNDDVVGGDSH
ncbi:MAG: TonB-dependent receptor [Muribaculaceae bacterium]|nr:TonB-dependent receptor [Muribaculaceae bacterium]